MAGTPLAEAPDIIIRYAPTDRSVDSVAASPGGDAAADDANFQPYPSSKLAGRRVWAIWVATVRPILV